MDYIHEPHINVELLQDYIERSGLKTNYICQQIGLSRQAFAKKRNGRFAFRVSEIYVLCDLLRIPTEDKEKIFYPKKSVISGEGI